MQEDRLFKTAHDALIFAFNFSAQQYERPMMNRMADQPVRTVSKGLAGMDGAAQAGFIFQQIERLAPLHQFIVFASYAPRTLPCECRRPCCSGTKRNELWEACIYEIEQAALSQALSGCVSHRVLRRGIVRRAFGDKAVSLEDLADRAGVNKNTATLHNSKIRIWLNGRLASRAHEEVIGVRAIALSRIESILIECGLVDK